MTSPRIPKGKNGGVHPDQLKRSDPMDWSRLEELRRRLSLKNNTEVLGEAISVLLLITDNNRRTFFVEDNDGKLIKINI